MTIDNFLALCIGMAVVCLIYVLFIKFMDMTVDTTLMCFFNSGNLSEIGRLKIEAYYIRNKGNPFHVEIVQILDIKDDYIKIKYVRTQHDYIPNDEYIKVAKFKDRFKLDVDFKPNHIHPELKIGNFNIYLRNDFWYVINVSPGFDDDFATYPKYKELSMALIENGL